MARSHGSSDWLLKMIRNDEIDSFLETIPGVKVTPKMRAPSKVDQTERELKTYLTEYGFDSEKSASIAEWWPNGGPKWDFICQAKIDGNDGIILVEAKAHHGEVGGKCKATNLDNINRIKSALQDTHAALVPGHAFSEETWLIACYQIANRIAFANKAHQVFGMPILLVFLGFVGDISFHDSWKDVKQWENEIWSCLDKLKLIDLTKVEMSEFTRRPGIRILSKQCAEII